MLGAVALGLTCLMALPLMAEQTENGKGKLKLVLIERTRFTGWDNTVSLDEAAADSTVFTRHRTTLGLDGAISDRMAFSFRLTNEFRTYLAPKSRANRFGEVFVDQAWLSWDKPADMPVKLTLGRQNIILGEGFLCIDGQPLTGSRSLYFNAVRTDWDLGQGQNLTVFLAHVPQYDDWLPVIHEGDTHQGLEEQANTVMRVYWTRPFSNGGELQANYFLKHSIGNQLGPERTVHTVGARLALPLTQSLKGAVEAALQFGKWAGNDHRAWGGYAWLEQKLPESLPFLTGLRVGTYMMSGDKADTTAHEAWDPLWGRFPKWSESYIYAMIRESKVANWNNIMTFFAGVLFRLSEKMDGQITLNFLTAPQGSTGAFAAYPEMAGTGKNRGTLIAGRVNYKIDTHWSGHFVYEHFRPGSYYTETAKPYNWIRFELLFSL